MTTITGLKWSNTRNLMVLAKGVEKSVRASIGNLNSKCPNSTLKMMPTFITEPVINDAKRILDSIFEKPYTMLYVDFCNYGVTLYIICIRGRRNNDIVLVDKREINRAFKYTDSAEKFFGYIAIECFKFVKDNTVKELYIAGRTLLCTILYRFDAEFLSLRESKVLKFLRNFQVEGCVGKDITKILSEQFKIHQGMAMFRIICTNLLCSSSSVTTGLCVQDKIPDLLALANHSVAFDLFDKRHQIEGHVGQKMLIDSLLHRFGDFIGSDDNKLLARFLVKADFDYKFISTDGADMMDKMTSYYWTCFAIYQFLDQTDPDMSKKFPSLKNPESISISDISNLLRYSENEKNEGESKLLDIYGCLNQDQKTDLVELCKELVHRSAKMMAAFTWGIIRTKDDEMQNGKIVVGLYGMMMNGMYGYKDLLKSTVDDLKMLDGKENLKIEYIEADDVSRNFGLAAISRYIGEYEQGKSFTLC